MRYADALCRYEEKNNPHRYVYTGPCIKCKTKQTVEIPGPELFRYRRGDLLQNAMPSVSKDQREFLLSGICPVCWDKMFPPEKEDE